VTDPNGIEKGVKLGLRCTLCGYELRPRANGCVGSGLMALIPGKVAGPQGRLAGLFVPCAEGKEAGWAARARLGFPQNRKRVGWAGSRVSWVSAHHRVGFRNSFSFSKSFYNLQTSLNPIQIRISTTSTRKIQCKNISPTKEKLCIGMKCNNQIFI
jgi:hypothetical protein